MAALLMGGALAGKVLGLLREIIMAHVIGVALVADGFRTAITIILMPLAFLQNESVPAILVPLMREAQERGEGPQRLAGMSIALTLIGVLLMLPMYAVGYVLVDWMVIGFSEEGRHLTLHMVYILALSMPASVLINCLAAGEVAIGRTRMTNLRAAALNVGVIIGLGFLVLTGYNYILAWAFTGAFNLLACWGVWRLVAEGNLSFTGVTPRLVIDIGREFLARLRPFLLLPGFEQANIWLERLLASRVVTGAVASLDYARTLTDSALLLLSQPIGLALLADGNRNDEREEIQKIARPLLAAGVPFAAFIYVFAEDIVRLVFERGVFGAHGVLLTSQALSGIAVGMWASTLGWVLLRLLNRSNRNTKAAIILMSAYAANIAMNLLTLSLWEGSGMEVFMLGLGEASRSIVLLLGVALALNCGGTLLRLFLVALVPAVCLVLAEWQFLQSISVPFEKLVLGGMLWCIATLAAAWMLCPDLLRLIVRKVARPLFRGKN